LNFLEMCPKQNAHSEENPNRLRTVRLKAREEERVL
jgi:hypothetical protein